MPSRKIITRFSKIIAALLFLTLLLTACQAAYSEPPMTETLNKEVMVEMAERAEGGVADSSNAGEFDPGGERMVIQNADISVVVDDPAKDADTIKLMAQELGGYVVMANVYKDTLEGGNKVTRASLKIRVPAENLLEALSRIKALSDQDPLRDTIDSQDVTSDYTDLQSSLRNEEATEAQLLKFLDQTTKTEETLQVYNELKQVRGNIERIKGQMNYLEQSVALSAIAVELVPDEAVQPLTIGGWQPGGVAKSAIQALINAVKGIVNVVIWLVILVLPVILILFVIFVLPVIVIVRLIRRAQRKRIVPGTKTSPVAPDSTAGDQP